MASTKTPPGSIDVDLIVSHVLGEQHGPTGALICIGGFVGESSRVDHIRLFTTMNFSECLDIPMSAIVRHQKVERPGIPEGTYVWFKRDAPIALTAVDSKTQIASFLQGPLLRSAPASTKMTTRFSNTAVGFFSTPICTIVVSIATVSLIICTRVDCPDPTDDCPESPETVTEGCPFDPLP